MFDWIVQRPGYTDRHLLSVGKQVQNTKGKLATKTLPILYHINANAISLLLLCASKLLCYTLRSIHPTDYLLLKKMSNNLICNMFNHITIYIKYYILTIILVL